MTTSGMRFSPASRKNVHRDNDPYVDPMPAGTPAVCPGCHAVREHRRWVMNEARAAWMLAKKEGVERMRCPACRKAADGYPLGTVTLGGAFLAFHHDEILHLVRNEEARMMGVNPMARIMSLTEEDGRMEVATTDEKLAQRIGRELRKAFRGEVEYRWSRGDRLLRVRWMRDA